MPATESEGTGTEMETVQFWPGMRYNEEGVNWTPHSEVHEKLYVVGVHNGESELNTFINNNNEYIFKQ